MSPCQREAGEGCWVLAVPCGLGSGSAVCIVSMKQGFLCPALREVWKWGKAYEIPEHHSTVVASMLCRLVHF